MEDKNQINFFFRLIGLVALLHIQRYSVIHLTAHMCRRTENEVGPTVGFTRQRHFVGFFNVPVQSRTRDHLFYGCSEKPPHFSGLLRCALVYGGRILTPDPQFILFFFLLLQRWWQREHPGQFADAYGTVCEQSRGPGGGADSWLPGTEEKSRGSPLHDAPKVNQFICVIFLFLRNKTKKEQ